MTNDDGWGSKWPVAEISLETAKERLGKVEWPSELSPISQQEIKNKLESAWPKVSQIEASTFIYTTKDEPWPITGHVVCDVDKDGNIDLTSLRDKLKSQGSNLVDDQAYLYFQCESCNEILDPHTKSFAKLQEHRINAGWKCIWNMNGQGYKVYCEKCEEKV